MKPIDTRSPDARFPGTRLTVIESLRSADPAERERAKDILVQAYWRPVYAYLRLRWKQSPEDAADLTQETLADVLHRDTLAGYEPERARLRTFLRRIVDRAAQNRVRDAGRQKRGGDREILPLDFTTAEGDLVRIEPPDPDDPEAFFDREWTRNFFAHVVDDLRRVCGDAGKPEAYACFEAYDLDDHEVTYQQLAETHGLPVTTITNRLAFARGEFRRLAMARLRGMTGSDAEFQTEARHLFGYRG